MGTNEDAEFNDVEREQEDLGATKNTYKNCRGKILLITIAKVCATIDVTRTHVVILVHVCLLS